ncbi:hypothetical protein [Sphingomonas sp. 1185]|uniref:hypothetical protein n=1 Tax=Sphingomonas sp. 1185 TaxID=3156411 RepID=UPI0033985E5A
MLIAAGLIALGGGAYVWAQAVADPPDLAACELHVREKLPSGVAYRRVDVVREDTGPLSPAVFRRQAGPSASVHGLGEAEKLSDLADEVQAKMGHLALRRMSLTYQRSDEAKPRTQICAFRLAEGKLERSDTLNGRATSRIGEGIDFLADRGKWARQSRPKHSCCL